MTIGSAPGGSASETISSSAPPSGPWRRGVLILADAAQLITISALTSADPLAVTWWALLLAIVPAPLAAAAAFAPAPVNRVAAVAGVAVLIAGIAGGIFFTLPCYRLTIRSSSDITRFVLLLVAGVAVSRLAARARRLKVIAITDAGCLASARTPDVVADHVREQLISLPGLETCRFEYGSLPGHPPRLEPGWTMLAGHGRRDAERPGLPGEEVELRVCGSGQSCGRLMLMPGPGSRLSPHACLVAVTLADQAGRGLAARVHAGST